MPGVTHLFSPAVTYGLIHTKNINPYNKADMQNKKHTRHPQFCFQIGDPWSYREDNQCIYICN